MMGSAIPNHVTEQTDDLIETHDPESDERARELAEEAAEAIVGDLSVSNRLEVIDQYRMVDESPEIALGTTTTEGAITRLAEYALTVDTYRRF